MPPIFIDNVNYKSEPIVEEPLNPIVPVIRVPNDEKVMEISNSTALVCHQVFVVTILEELKNT